MMSDEQGARSPASGARDVPGPTVLVADDDADMRRLTRRVLTRLGYRVLMAADGREALELYRARQAEIDVILTDMAMPEMSGGELYRAVRDGGDREMKFLLMSGFLSRRHGGWDLVDPGVPFLPKPWTLEELDARLWDVLSGSRPRGG